MKISIEEVNRNKIMLSKQICHRNSVCRIKEILTEIMHEIITSSNNELLFYFVNKILRYILVKCILCHTSNYLYLLLNHFSLGDFSLFSFVHIYFRKINS